LTDISGNLWLIRAEVLVLLNQSMENFFFTPHWKVAAGKSHDYRL
tara:strand:+ start:5125 stop:5259 length:135 start_codon:yes stop_codon:yes gene_type:complete